MVGCDVEGVELASRERKMTPVWFVHNVLAKQTADMATGNQTFHTTVDCDKLVS